MQNVILFVDPYKPNILMEYGSSILHAIRIVLK